MASWQQGAILSWRGGRTMQKGQSMVEFALVVPFFIMVFLIVSYMGLLFVDYLAFSDIARSSAREAALGGAGQYQTIRNKYISAYNNGDLMHTHLYTWDPSSWTDFSIQDVTSGQLDNAVQVKIQLNLDQTNDLVATMGSMGLPETLALNYSMHKETQ